MAVLGVRLKAEEVPGAVLEHSVICKNKVDDLKRWLQCRGMKMTGNKKDLVERVENCIKNKTDEINVKVDKGKLHEIKTDELNKKKGGNTDIFPKEPKTGSWEAFPHVNVPKNFNEGHILYYMVESCPVMNLVSLALKNATNSTGDKRGGEESDDDDDEVETGTMKQMKRGKRYIKSGYVHEVEDNESKSFCFVRAKVQASMRKEFHSVTVAISKISGSVRGGLCDCKASALGRCSHISALLQWILQFVEKNGHSALSCTSKPQAWGKGSKIKNPGLINNSYSENEPSQKKIALDPRCSAFQKEAFSEMEKNNFFLYTMESSNVSESIWNKMTRYQYENFAIDKELKSITENQVSNLLENLQNLARNAKSDPFQIRNTDGQSLSPAWHNFRRIIFTSSEAKEVLGLQKDEAKMHYLQKKLWGEDFRPTGAMKYGLDNEPNARDSYEREIKSSGLYDDVKVATTGLWVSKDFPLGCSPDGIVTRKNLQSGLYEAGLLEIKCPQILKNCHPEDFQTNLSKKQLQNFCLTLDNGKIVLKSNHKYYYQVQLSLGIQKLPWCDFVVWSKHGILKLTVHRDDTFFFNISQKLTRLHRQFLAPEYFLMRTIRDLPPVLF